jgi:hypothetical protein
VVFGRSERDTLRAFVVWAVDADADRAAEVVDALDELFAEVPREPRLFVRAALAAIGVGCLVRHGRRLSALDPLARDRYLRGWLEHPFYGIRSLAKVVYLNVLMSWYARDEEAARRGFRPAELVALRHKLAIVDPRAVPPPEPP